MITTRQIGGEVTDAPAGQSAAAAADAFVAGIATAPAPRAAEPRLAEAGLPDPEPAGQRRACALLAVALALGYFMMLLHFWAPATPGVDQNGYLVGGKQLARSGSTGFKPDNPLEYVGGMWVLAGEPASASDAWFYPKYPPGLPLLNAIPLWIDWQRGKHWALLISPICTSLALVAMFLMTRLLAGSFAGILAMILLGSNYTALVMANMPWSHGPALAFATWGMYLLLRWWQTGSGWRGALAGFVLGYAMTIRYTEGLLVIPLAVTALLIVRWTERASYPRAAMPLVGWLVPVLWMLGFNCFAMGTITGYDTTNESSAFTLARLRDQWETVFQQLYDYGVFFILPLAVLGLAMMWRWNWRIALILMLWLVPGMVVYTSYYWGRASMSWAYLRFFLTLFPPMILAAVWYVTQQGKSQPAEGRRSFAAPIAAGVVVAFASAVGLRNALPVMLRDVASNWNLAYTTDTIIQRVPAGSVLFIEQRGWMSGLLNFIQWQGDYELYSMQAFRWRPGVRFGGDTSSDQPHPLQPARERWLNDVVYLNSRPIDLMQRQDRIIAAALGSGRRAFLVQAVDWSSGFRLQFGIGQTYQAKPLARWKELLSLPNIEQTALMPPPRSFAAGRSAQTWQLYEITRAQASLHTATQPPATATTAPGNGS
ncbi:ArnT family glycosyltransferase [Fontivita pretiosa]|uniref:ArnT family glycosyltransferase n=1 Tax=Fontivita pretiosa TaxID=2989684 RepID=UPI003D17ECBD